MQRFSEKSPYDELAYGYAQYLACPKLPVPYGIWTESAVQHHERIGNDLTTNKRLLVMVPGFNYDLASSLGDTLALQAEMAFDFPTLVFSWHSEDYIPATRKISHHAAALERALVGYMELPQTSRVDLMCHLVAMSSGRRL